MSYALGAGEEIEFLRAYYTGTTGLSLTGNEKANTVIGGADTLTGGLGVDQLTGGAGTDSFVFATLTDSGTGAARDTIVDFVSGTDRIDLSPIDADTTAGGSGNEAFGFIGSGAFTGEAGQLHQVSVDGNGSADFQILLRGLHTLQAGDFVP